LDAEQLLQFANLYNFKRARAIDAQKRVIKILFELGASMLAPAHLFLISFALFAPIDEFKRQRL
jgi:hypothetical protein